MNNLIDLIKSTSLLVGILVALGGCGGTEASSPPILPSAPPPVISCDANSEYCGDIPDSANPCSDSEYWPLTKKSGTYPIDVHYSRIEDGDRATRIVTFLDESWMMQVDTLGFSAPLDDAGECGSDGRYDVFIWRGYSGAYVTHISPNLETAHDDYTTYTVIHNEDEYLNTYVAHEFNHAVQASDDWGMHDSSVFYEMSASFAEALPYPESVSHGLQDDWVPYLEDFQATPESSLFIDDYDTWHMYGATLYLHYLWERYFPDDAGFIARVWLENRNSPGEDRPDYIDALRLVLLNERGITFEQTITEFMQWRWFLGQFDDGLHFARGALWNYPVAHTVIDVINMPITISVQTMMFGSNYFRLQNSTDSEISLNINLFTDESDIVWDIFSVEGNQIISNFNVSAQSSTILVVAAMPTEQVYSGDFTFEFHDAELTLSTP
ncbi:MAG: hypothetical protein CMO98_07720 [Woeseia sp.]|nr:hypothetical protein [Woeseia sp.]